MTDEEEFRPFYSPPTNCIELEKIGYTLNGYYLVNGSENSNQVEVVLCRFKLPPGNNTESIYRAVYTPPARLLTTPHLANRLYTKFKKESLRASFLNLVHRRFAKVSVVSRRAGGV